LRRDPAARHYTDVALTPVADEEFETLDLFTARGVSQFEQLP
jgi:hypothetical protein